MTRDEEAQRAAENGEMRKSLEEYSTTMLLLFRAVIDSILKSRDELPGSIGKSQIVSGGRLPWITPEEKNGIESVVEVLLNKIKHWEGIHHTHVRFLIERNLMPEFNEWCSEKTIDERNHRTEQNQ